MLPEAKYHPKRHLSKQKPNLSWIRTGVDKKPNEIPVTEVVTNLKKPCDKSRRRILKKYISVPKSAILKLKPNKDEVGHFEIEAKQRRVGHF